MKRSILKATIERSSRKLHGKAKDTLDHFGGCRWSRHLWFLLRRGRSAAMGIRCRHCRRSRRSSLQWKRRNDSIPAEKVNYEYFYLITFFIFPRTDQFPFSSRQISELYWEGYRPPMSSIDPESSPIRLCSWTFLKTIITKKRILTYSGWSERETQPDSVSVSTFLYPAVYALPTVVGLPS